jgi:ankyrin repeat protein
MASFDRLLESGRSLDEQDGTMLGYTPLIVAAREGFPDAVKRLIEAGANIQAGDTINGTPLHHAAVGGETEIAAELLRAGADVNAVDDNGTTPLIRVSLHADAVKYLKGQQHPLHRQHLATAKVLLAAGAQIDHMAGNGYSALHNASENGAAALISLLLKAGATVDLANGLGARPCMWPATTNASRRYISCSPPEPTSTWRTVSASPRCTAQRPSAPKQW